MLRPIRKADTDIGYNMQPCAKKVILVGMYYKRRRCRTPFYAHLFELKKL